MHFSLLAARGGMGGFVSSMIRTFIQIVIYQICIGFIMEIFGVNQWVAMFIFLGILLGLGLVTYIIRQRMAPGVED
jgi:ABC-type Mn2+/Zn2+ transport system permease subunit